jgi:threonine/homoserine/homoserine lactone efflux protein
MGTVLATVDGGQLLQVVWVSIASGIAVTLLFSLVVLFGSRSADHQRSGRSVHAFAHGTAALLFMVAFGVLVAYGVHIMLTKS